MRGKLKEGKGEVRKGKPTCRNERKTTASGKDEGEWKGKKTGRKRREA